MLHFEWELIHGFDSKHECWLQSLDDLVQLKYVRRRLFSYKTYKLANFIPWNGRHEYKIYDSLDKWWYQTGSVMKHVSTTTTNCTNGGAQNNCEDVSQNVSHDVHVK